MKGDNNMNKKNKLIVRIFAAFLAGLMILGVSTSLLYMLFVK